MVSLQALALQDLLCSPTPCFAVIGDQKRCTGSQTHEETRQQRTQIRFGGGRGGRGGGGGNLDG